MPPTEPRSEVRPSTGSGTRVLERDDIARALRPLGEEDRSEEGQGETTVTEGAARFSDHDLNSPPPGRFASLRPAAVLVPLIARRDGFTVLLTRRTEHLRNHAGQISFPGGRVDHGDAGVVDAALREAHEEVGLPRGAVEVAGLLDDYETVTGYLVTPVVGFVSPHFEPVLDEFEVADAFEVPLDFLLDHRNHAVHGTMRSGRWRRYYVMEYGSRYIWGATAGMIMNLHRRVLAARVDPA